MKQITTCFSNGFPPKATLYEVNKHTESLIIKEEAKPDIAPLISPSPKYYLSN